MLSYLKMSAAARRGNGCMVYVLPDPVCPYAKQVACVHVRSSHMTGSGEHLHPCCAGSSNPTQSMLIRLKVHVWAARELVSSTCCGKTLDLNGPTDAVETSRRTSGLHFRAGRQEGSVGFWE